jgi:excisionase family DNA binding protein
MREERVTLDKLLSIDKAAEILSVSPWTIRSWITHGKLGSAKLGSRRLVPQSELERLILKSSVPALERPTEVNISVKLNEQTPGR